MATVRSFPPVVAEGARVLVLGSVPGEKSVAARQYYAHPANDFWPIVAKWCGFDAGLAYEERLQQLGARGIALWDVLASCEREGSLDASIAPASMRCNDFAGLFAAHPTLGTVLCNGTTAHTTFCRRVLPELGERGKALHVLRLPSTSPAHAGVRTAEKQAAWAAALTAALRSR
jgi:TDG/mug DNA glycosylase family protein